MARFATTFWRLVQCAQAFLPLGGERCLESFLKALADDPDNEYAMIDATIVRAHQHSAGALKKGSRPSHRPLARWAHDEIDVIVDALGNPLRLILTGGQVHDITQADALLGLIEPGALLADKGHDADHFADSLIARAIKVVIPPKSNRKAKCDRDFALYCERNLVERFFWYNQAFSGDRDAL